METKHIKVTYIGHSGFLVELSEVSLVFDYYTGRLPEIRKDRPLIVFASHSHPDHFQKKIFQWRKEYPDTTYVLSSDIFQKFGEGNVLRMKPHEEAAAGPCVIRTLRSTDEGVAFVVQCGDVKIYHAGDLNWWHWEEETGAYNAQMKEDYQREIGRIEGETFEAAFAPVDKRLENAYFWGLDWFVRHTDTRKVFPMHFWDRYEVYQDLMNQRETAGYRDKIVNISQKGEVFEWEI